MTVMLLSCYPKEPPTQFVTFGKTYKLIFAGEPSPVASPVNL